MVTTSKLKNGTTKAKTATKSTGTLDLSDPKVATKAVRNALFQTYKIKLPLREESAMVPAYYGLREILGNAVSASVKRNSGTFDWQAWNTKVFPKLFGEPDALKFDLAVMAQIAAHFDASIPEDSEAGIRALIEVNRRSLERRNNRKATEPDVPDVLDSLDDLDLDDELDSEDADELDDDELDLDDE
jgi:hypothetical protein